MKSFKYLHIMTHPAMFFNENIIDMIHLNNDTFDSAEHLFIVGYEDIYNKYKMYDNVILIPKIMTKNYGKFLRYCNNAQFVFLHQNWFYDFIRLLITPIKIRKKYIWCVWGHDLYTNYGMTTGLKERTKMFLRKIGGLLINFESKYYKGIGIGFKYDALEIKKRFKKNINIYLCPYRIGLDKEVVERIKSSNDTVYENKSNIKIMIGHSAHSYLNHKKILKKLEKFKDENILISLPLVYGNQKYAQEVIQYSKSIFGEDKVEVLERRLSSVDYIKYLNSVDVAIMDQVQQSGLGNLYSLLFLNKKVYLNGDGVLSQAFFLEGLYLNETSQIDRQSFEEFAQCSNKSEYWYPGYMLDDTNMIRMWKETLKKLSS
ncbi:TDP-N-acetylfucosamine:lipid II N-acetylfucosaminyltransferase [Longirhabdus pacifica]|uniref:TDP-N-acetylfucosamine:lipid II N-acetylfucosaminyltransferase n=1 Tax=Longirhabdus pacifica TaxID=2305227 RepID=UPI001008B9F2|nr:TDP-N-acetylfucosamine:lipid II N-acetylfucosaminyltransferase [Longirhabdus pacifica]